MSRNKYLSAFLLAASVSVGIWGCAQAPSDLNVTQAIANNPVTVFGKVIDSQTRQGIGAATVYIKVNGNWQSTTTTASTIIGDTLGSGDSTTGDYTFSGLPVNTTMPIIVQSPTTGGYLQRTGTITTNDYSGSSDGVNSQISQDLGQMAMEKGIVATVYVVDANTGSYVIKSDSSALPVYLGMGGNGSVEDVMAARDTTDTNKYTITIPQTGSSTLTVPALDTTADGVYDYQTGATTITASGAVVSGVGTLTTTIALAPITNGTALGPVASNIRNVGANSGGTPMNVIGKSDPVKLLFNMPVALPTTTTDGVTMTFTDNFKTLTAAAVVTEVTVTAALSSGNTLLTITPSAALTEGQTYTMNGTVTSKQTGVVDTVYSLGTTTVTVTQTGTGTIGSTPTVTVDNFNHWTNGKPITALSGTVTTNATTTVTGTGTAFTTELVVGNSVIIGTDATVYTVATIPTATSFTTTVAVPAQTTVTVLAGPALANGNARLVFPEPVWGTVRLISSTTGTTTTISNGTPVALTGQTVAYVIKALSTDAFNTDGGNVSGAIYPFDMTAAGMLGTVADSTTATPRSLLLGIDAYDADGNTMRTEASYSVQ
ncbi:MAG: hypothetical protein AABY54_07050 [Deltaproteobacteria bacterium]